ncbi:UDP-N-acetylmuramoyl-L-alanyl-D-glutamate--2,6-diaminopimelate ligase [Pontibacillus yanchengensis]|uniref:UDP-N-acetylmuramoyl-L-alanyl-D-glutamate--2, 6-diaminopimelate ligase n=1 Tax=Pontibacillus yanchengensis TaxID=462910 RepID=A0ACC7VCE0_9BACI|nr:UDP-N-acetylmuramoyl-L-alanyl-D-glutamate--2,6-diaminopimelate ligase [Pontibacillus yanchengensis]
MYTYIIKRRDFEGRGVSMKLNDVINNIDYELIQGTEDTYIESISYHSKHIEQDSLFVCIKGQRTDGHDYIAQAVMKGASAIIVERKVALEFIPEDLTVIQVDKARSILPSLASQFYQYPSRDFRLVGVTGTNGKTSVSHMISSILQHAGRKVGSIGTLGNKVNEMDIESRRTTPTTPEALDLQDTFSKMKQSSVSDVVMEVSSMGLALDRVNGCDFDIGVFMNLTQDHLDDHGTFDNYKQAKLKLFKSCPFSIINADDEHAHDFIDASIGKYTTFGITNGEADLRAVSITSTASSVSFTLEGENLTEEISVPIPGEFTVYNSLAAIASCLQMGLSIEKIKEALAVVKSPEGRLQTIESDQGFSVMIDYANTPDALENVLSNIRAYTAGKLMVVFGCGGDKDPKKRAKMGQIASRWCDHMILTSDNPRSENPSTIIQDIEEGVLLESSYEVIEDRRKAIERSILLAEQGDIILIAGKGFETDQIIGETVLPFNDVEVVKSRLASSPASS